MAKATATATKIDRPPVKAGAAFAGASERRVISLPKLAGSTSSGFPFHLNIHLNRDESAALQLLAESLDRDQATLAGGKRVTDKRTAARWLFEQLVGNTKNTEAELL